LNKVINNGPYFILNHTKRNYKKKPSLNFEKTIEIFSQTVQSEEHSNFCFFLINEIYSLNGPC